MKIKLRTRVWEVKKDNGQIVTLWEEWDGKEYSWNPETKVPKKELAELIEMVVDWQGDAGQVPALDEMDWEDLHEESGGRG